MSDRALVNEINEFVTARTDFGFMNRLKNLPRYQEAAGREKQLLQELQDLVADKDSNRLFNELENITSMLIGLYADNAYCQGLSDGAKIQQMLG